MDHSIDLDLRTPETKADVSIWHEFGKIQSPPIVNTYTAKDACYGARFMLSVGP
jgi:hypothetical protein